MIVQCPYCFSDNVTNLSADSNDFICNDCGENFQADNDTELEDDAGLEEGTEGSGFIDLDPKTALKTAREARQENEGDNTNG